MSPSGYLLNSSKRKMFSHVGRIQRRHRSSLSSFRSETIVLRTQQQQLSASATASNKAWRLRPCLLSSHRNGFSTLSKTPTSNGSSQSKSQAQAQSQPNYEELSAQATAIINSKYLQKEEAETDAALFLDSTSPPGVLARASLYTNDDAVFSKILHRAFLHLTAKNLVHASPTTAIELARRAHRFGLCFHLPLYKQLILTVATHYSSLIELAAGDHTTMKTTSSRPASVILEMASFACQSLQVALEATFFSSTLLALVTRNLLKDAVLVLRAMRDRHDIDRLPSHVTIQLLTLLKDQVALNVVDEMDASDLMMMLHSMLMDEYDEIDDDDDDDDDDDNNDDLDDDDFDETLTKIVPSSTASDELLVENNGNLLDALNDILDEYDAETAYIADDAYAAAVAEDDYFNSMLDMEPADIRAAMEEYLQQKEWSPDDDDNGQGVPTFVPVVQGSPETAYYEASPTTRILNRHHDEIMKEAVYLRDAKLWKLPDVTEQLERLSVVEGSPKKSSGVLYTHAYEEHLLMEMMSSETDE